MSSIDLSQIANDVVYDLHVNEMHGRLSPSRPTIAKPERMSTVAIARVAVCLEAGVPISGAPAGLRTVLGSSEWQSQEAPDLSDFPASLPSRIALSEDGLGVTEWHGTLKYHYRECKNPECEKGFMQRRGGRAKARWKETCSDPCRKAWKNERQRITRAA